MTLQPALEAGMTVISEEDSEEGFKTGIGDSDSESLSSRAEPCRARSMSHIGEMAPVIRPLRTTSRHEPSCKNGTSSHGKEVC